MTNLIQPTHKSNHKLTGFGGDIDGFFGLLVDNIIQLLVILTLLKFVIKIPDEIILRQIIPAVGVSVVFGNIFYAAQAWYGSRKEGKRKTALPYGINTPSVFAYLLFIMLPVYLRTDSWDAAYAAGMVACIGSGLIEFFGSFFARWIRAVTPRAALLSALAGIALTFISMDFVVRIFADPLIGLIPLAILLAGYFGRAKMPFGLPAGLVAIIVGASLAWILSGIKSYAPDTLGWIINDADNIRQLAEVTASTESAGWFLPDPTKVWPEIRDAFISREWIGYIGVILPMGLFNLIGSLQNLESAEAAGDRYNTTSSLAINGLGSILGGFLGSCFPTTIYIGHPGWKGMGAGWSYSLLNAIAIVGICLTGLVVTLESVIPITAGAGILLWIGVIITAQAFTAVPRNHAGAVAVGLFPAIAGLLILIGFSPYISGTNNMILTVNSSTSQITETVETQPVSIMQPIESVADEATEDVGADTIAEMSTDEMSAEITTPVTPALPNNVKLITVQDELESNDPNAGKWSGFSIHGLLRLERGLLLIAMIWAAITACIIDRKWMNAGIWSLAAAFLTAMGIIHSYAIMGNDLHYMIPGIALPDNVHTSPALGFVIAYVIIAAIFIIPARLSKSNNGSSLKDTFDGLDEMDSDYIDTPPVTPHTPTYKTPQTVGPETNYEPQTEDDSPIPLSSDVTDNINSDDV